MHLLGQQLQLLHQTIDQFDEKIAQEKALDYPRKPLAEPGPPRSMAPAEMFGEFYRRRNGAEASEDLRKLFEAVYEEAHG